MSGITGNMSETTIPWRSIVAMPQRNMFLVMRNIFKPLRPGQNDFFHHEKVIAAPQQSLLAQIIPSVCRIGDGGLVAVAITVCLARPAAGPALAALRIRGESAGP
jgi:hypothetical protein